MTRTVTGFLLTLLTGAAALLADGESVTVKGLTVTVEPTQAAFRPGFGPILRVTFRNESKEAFSLLNAGDVRGWTVTYGPYDAVFPLPDAGKAPQVDVLKPGQDMTVRVDLGEAAPYWKKLNAVLDRLPEGASQLAITMDLARGKGDGPFWTGTIKTAPVPIVIADDAPIPAGTSPAGLPLKAVLTAKANSYRLAEGQTGRRYRMQLRAIHEAGQSLPAVPKVDLVLEITNTSTVPITIASLGPLAQLELCLTGGAVAALETASPQAQGRVTIQPGQSHKIAIDRLTDTRGGRPRNLYWTQSGEVRVQAVLATAVLAGVESLTPGQRVSIASNAVTLKVTNPDGSMTPLPEPQPLQEGEFEQIVDRLGDRSFRVREKATKRLIELLEIDPKVHALIDEHLKKPGLDPEVAERLRHAVQTVSEDPARPRPRPAKLSEVEELRERA